MENRRQTIHTSSPRNRDKFSPRSNDNANKHRNFQSRDSKLQNREGKVPNQDGSVSREFRRFPKRDENPRGRNESPMARGGRFVPKNRVAPKGKQLKPWEKENKPRIVSDMQVTDGKHRGKYLKSSDSLKVRPTSRRIREVMFRILFRRVRAGRFLDLCAGAGTVGIEAISRGALIGTFVERSSKMCSFIKKNMESMGIKEGHGEVFELEVVPFLKKMAKRRRYWDVVYYDPPYDANYDEVLDYFSRGAAVKSGGTLVIEHHAEMFFPETFGEMNRWRVLVQGETALSFYERKQAKI